MTIKFENNECVSKSLDWLGEQLHSMLDVLVVEEDGKYGSFEWPLSDHKVHPLDVESTIKLLDTPYRTRHVGCALSGLNEKLNSEFKDIDYFFIHVHAIGHAILEDLKPDLDYENIHDVGLAELVTVFFAIMACHRYYGLKKITPDMAFEIAGVLQDVNMVDATRGRMYSHQDKVVLACKALDKLISNEKQSLRQ